MTPADRPGKSTAITAMLQRTRVARGLPFHIEDRATLAKVTAMVRAVLQDQAEGED